jgi:N-acetylglucosaminyldiphosphoundecaprenol N-acetyl-beta-D-mannosaminyltransferase
MIKKIIGIAIKDDNIDSILDKIKLGIANKEEMTHVVSMNPEILVEATENETFKRIVETAQIQIIDGVGIVAAARILNLEIAPRVSGVDLMERLLTYANLNSLSVGLIGGREKVADRVIECQKLQNPELKAFGMMGIKNINSPKMEEENEIFRIVTDRKPHLLFVSFGSPMQEIWIERHRDQLKGIVCIGVGGAFDYLSGEATRPPRIIRIIGLEWLFRLVAQPWRWKRQLKLFKFMWLVMKQKLNEGK